MNRADAIALIKQLHAAGLSYGPDIDASGDTARAWLDVLGDLRTVDVQDAVRRYMSGEEGERWPAPGKIRALAVTHGDHTPTEAPQGCQACGGSGTLLARWVLVTRARALEERTRPVYCECERARWLQGQHGQSKPGEGGRLLHIESAPAFAEGISRSPRGTLDCSATGLLWWVIEDRARPWDQQAMPAHIRTELTAQTEQQAQLRTTAARMQRAEVRDRSGRVKRDDGTPQVMAGRLAIVRPLPAGEREPGRREASDLPWRDEEGAWAS